MFEYAVRKLNWRFTYLACFALRHLISECLQQVEVSSTLRFLREVRSLLLLMTDELLLLIWRLLAWQIEWAKMNLVECSFSAEIGLLLLPFSTGTWLCRAFGSRAGSEVVKLFFPLLKEGSPLFHSHLLFWLVVFNLLFIWWPLRVKVQVSSYILPLSLLFLLRFLSCCFILSAWLPLWICWRCEDEFLTFILDIRTVGLHFR